MSDKIYKQSGNHSGNGERSESGRRSENGGRPGNSGQMGNGIRPENGNRSRMEREGRPERRDPSAEAREGGAARVNTAGTEGELSEKIEKMTESLLSHWEISEDDFEDTQDLAAAAAQISGRLGEKSAAVNGREAAESRRSTAGAEAGRRRTAGAERRTESNAERAQSGQDVRHAEKDRHAAGERRAEGSHRENAHTEEERRADSPRRQEEGTRREDVRAERVRRTEEARHTEGTRRTGEARMAGERRTEGSRRENAHAEGERRADSPRRQEEGTSREDVRVERARRTEEARHAEGARHTEEARHAEGARRTDKARETGERRTEGERRTDSPRRREDAHREEGARRAEDARRFGASRSYSAAKHSQGHSAGKKGNSRRKKENPIVAFWNGLQPMDKVVGFTGIAVCLFAVLTFSVVLNAKSLDRQVEAFAAVGENMSQISVADEGTFLAVADGMMARQEAAGMVSEEESEEEEYEEIDDTSDVQVGLNMTSVEKDLKIKFVNRKTGKLIPYVSFQVEIKGPDQTYQKTDDDKDGIIYLTGITGGSYTVRITGPTDLEGYAIPTDAQSVTVKNQIEYQKIDVSDEIKKESEVNAAKEDTEIKTQVESVIQDTVEWVESTKTPVGGDGSEYVEVKKENIPDPAATASLEFALFAGKKSGQDSGLMEAAARPWRGFGLIKATESQPESSSSEAPSSEAPTESSSAPEPSSEEPSSTEPSSSEQPPEPSSSVQPTEPSSSEGPSKPSNVSVTGVSLDRSSATATVGDSFTLVATVSPDNATNKSVKWTSSNDSVAAVSGGTVTCKSAGTATITATTEDGGKTAACTVTVSTKQVAVEKVEITGEAAVKVGASITLTANVTPSGATYDTITWTTSDSSIATVSGGTVKGVKAGTVTITATAGGKSGSKQITVSANVANSLTVNDMTITAGENKKANYSAGGEISSTTFSIENTKYATVDGSGNVKAIRAGETKYTVTVKFKDGSTRSDTKKLTVKAAEVKGITLDRTSVTLKVGESLKLNPTITTSGYTGCLWYTSDKSIVTVEEHGGGTITAVKAGKVTITACSSEDTSKKATCEVTVTGTAKDPRQDTTTPLKDKDGNQLYVKDSSGKYVAAVVADYYKYNQFFKLNGNVEYKYTGWQTIDGKRYFFDKNGNKVTGEQVIQGVKYSFGSDGALSGGSGVLGIDVSKHNGSINWAEVKNAGVSFVIIRCGYRGSSTGAMIEDPMFASNIKGATAAGLKVGVYFFSQAVNRVEAIEEASMTLQLIRNYKISYPVFLDVEAAGGRADGVDAATRTDIVNAYCQTIRNSGYTAGVYANKTWLGSKMNVGSFGSNKIWLAQYAAAPTYNGRYEMWQYSSKGRISGISGNVDLNISYLGY